MSYNTMTLRNFYQDFLVTVKMYIYKYSESIAQISNYCIYINLYNVFLSRIIFVKCRQNKLVLWRSICGLYSIATWPPWIRQTVASCHSHFYLVFQQQLWILINLKLHLLITNQMHFGVTFKKFYTIFININFKNLHWGNIPCMATG